MATMNMEDYGWNPPVCWCQEWKGGHPEECGCDHCHECREHNWRDWNGEPACELCMDDMREYWTDGELGAQIVLGAPVAVHH